MQASSLFRRIRDRSPEILFFTIVGCLAVGLFTFVQHYRADMVALLLSPSQRDQFLAQVGTRAQDFLTLLVGILVEALPFVVLGVLISVIIQLFLPTDLILRRLPKNTVARRFIMSFLGVLMPVCECGNVPVARSLIIKGFSVQEAIVFLLAAPSVNIVTFVVTWEAFNFDHSVAVIRVLATLVVANTIAFLVAKLVAPSKLLTPEFAATCEVNAHAPKTLASATELFRSEMWLITRMLVIGAIIAAASQTFIPREVITAISSDVFLSVVAMLALAFIISICSSVDAFFALAYVNTFSLGSILAFLVAGPMVDIKMIALMKTTFTYRVLAVITGGVLVLSLIIGVWFSYVW